MISPVLYVSDVDTSMAFYTRKLGAVCGGEITGPDGETSKAVVRFGSARFRLQALPAGQSCFCARDVIVELDPEVNIQQLYVEMRLKGVFMLCDLEDLAHSDRSFCVEDPDGYRWEFVRRAYGTVATSERAVAAQGGVRAAL